MKTKHIILLTHDLYDRHLNLFHEYAGPDFEWIRIVFSQKPANFINLIEKAVAVVSRQDLTDEEYRVSKELKLLQVPIAGYENINLDRAKRYGVYVCNNGGANAISVSEHVFLLILALYRQFLFHNKNVRNGTFKNRKYNNLELSGKAIGIIGLGHCGKEVAKRAKAFGMNVNYFDILRPAKLFEQSLSLVFTPLRELLSSSDIVSLHVPLTSITRKMINSETIGLMKKQSILINASRGEVVDENDLIHALENRRIRGAGLDVFEKEPLSKDSPLIKLDNVVLTPHCGASYESTFRMCENIVNNIKKILKNKKPDFIAADYENIKTR